MLTALLRAAQFAHRSNAIGAVRAVRVAEIELLIEAVFAALSAVEKNGLMRGGATMKAVLLNAVLLAGTRDCRGDQAALLSAHRLLPLNAVGAIIGPGVSLGAVRQK
ncbi:MAG: hypothetical protein KDD69_11185 [Bdellovibrionales bacterium]|nr:hypothetical protein [Bdellovibrionales bacterium]